MDPNVVIQMIGSVGFPIVCCGAMAWYVKYITDKNREQIDSMNEKHQGEMVQITEALNNNTKALQHLSDIMDTLKDGTE